MSLKIKDVRLISREGRWDVLIDDGEIKDIGKGLEGAEECIEGDGKYLLPGFVNTHTHAAMSLLRGYADDMELDKWLQEKIWPLEGKLTDEDIYWGTKLACLEMIRSGTVAFNDMYFFMERAADAVAEMGMKATLAYGFLDLGDEEKREEEKQNTEKVVEYLKGFDLIQPAVGPHSIYSVSKEALEWCSDYSSREGMPIHIHIAETKKEMEDFSAEHEGCITDYLIGTGILDNEVVGAHCVWLEDGDYSNMSEKGVFVSHNPSSNMKLGVGKPMDYQAMNDAGITVTLGTDGCASNNNLDMLEEIKIAALQQKMQGDPTLLPAEEAFEILTLNGAEALGTGGGKVEIGYSADLILVDPGVAGTPGHDIVSDLIYSLNGSCVDDVIIDGEIVMRDRHVKGEEEIIKNATERAKRLTEGDE